MSEGNNNATEAVAGIVWIDATKQLPDDEQTVLIALSDGEVWTGFHEDDQWHYVSADSVDQGSGTTVTHWAQFPEPPKKTDPSVAEMEAILERHPEACETTRQLINAAIQTQQGEPIDNAINQWNQFPNQLNPPMSADQRRSAVHHFPVVRGGRRALPPMPPPRRT